MVRETYLHFHRKKRTLMMKALTLAKNWISLEVVMKRRMKQVTCKRKMIASKVINSKNLPMRKMMGRTKVHQRTKMTL